MMILMMMIVIIIIIIIIMIMIMNLFRCQVIYIYPAKGLLIGDTIFTTLRLTENIHMTDKCTHKHTSLQGPTV